MLFIYAKIWFGKNQTAKAVSRRVLQPFEGDSEGA